MTTTDFEAALDRYEQAAQNVGYEFAHRHPHQSRLDDLAEARAAVVALAPDRARVEKLERLASSVWTFLDFNPVMTKQGDPERLRHVEAAARALDDGEPEDAGVGGTSK